MLQFNSDNLFQILKSFYTLTKIRIVLIDSDFNELLSYPKEQQGFCAMIRKNLQVNTNCVTSDRNGCLKCAKTKELVIYRCHAGLTETVVPIHDKNGIMGYVMFGQVLPAEDYEVVKKRLRRQYPERQFRGIGEVIEQIPVRSSDELNAAALILQAITSYVLTNRWVTPKKSEFIRRLDNLIATRLEENITVDDVCAEFHMGRTRLYDVAADYLGCGLAEYIRKQRIQYAQKMLENRGLSVAEVAYATGFSDYNSFARTFRQVSGVSARQFRKNLPD
ncbi:MAG: helix-turn-helix domain-containing protein [Oscillospiraceae bacterium]|nr:helix-turn-helix domain-containing protein [Oscillospiraceae bacterium]